VELPLDLEGARSASVALSRAAVGAGGAEALDEGGAPLARGLTGGSEDWWQLQAAGWPGPGAQGHHKIISRTGYLAKKRPCSQNLTECVYTINGSRHLVGCAAQSHSFEGGHALIAAAPTRAAPATSSARSSEASPVPKA